MTLSHDEHSFVDDTSATIDSDTYPTVQIPKSNNNISNDDSHSHSAVRSNPVKNNTMMTRPRREAVMKGEAIRRGVERRKVVQWGEDVGNKKKEGKMMAIDKK